jgi:hypothetical protein
MDISYSALHTYLTCPTRFTLKYQFRTPEPQSDWVVLGQMLHNAIETYAELGDGVFKIFLDNANEWYKLVSAPVLSEEQFYNQVERSLDVLQVVLQEFDLSNIAIEREFRMPYKQGYDLVGRVDYLSPNLLMDWKFKKDFRNLDPLQLSFYKRLTGYRGRAGWFVITWSGDYNFIEADTSITDELLDAYLLDLIVAIEKNDFPPNSNSCKWCPYKNVCKASDLEYEEFYLE